eukprot:317980-Chlamydomonas_euryale.AAC.1
MGTVVSACDCLAGRVAGWLAGWRAGWLAEWFAGLLVFGLIEHAWLDLPLQWVDWWALGGCLGGCLGGWLVDRMDMGRKVQRRLIVEWIGWLVMRKGQAARRTTWVQCTQQQEHKSPPRALPQRPHVFALPQRPH